MPTPSFHPAPSKPRLALPAGACDAHVHVFGPGDRFPYDPARGAPPADAPKERLFALHRNLGIQRCVIVNSQVHGHDNRVAEDAIAAGGGHYLGVALLPTDVPDAELRRLAGAGFRGVRLHFMDDSVPATAIAAMEALARRLQPLGLHLQLHLRSEHLHVLKPAIGRSPVPVVIDHMARVDAALGAQHPDLLALRSLLGHAHCHVKVSGVDRITRAGHYAPGVPLAASLVRDFQHQCVWGTDWPHPGHDHVPDDGVLVDLLAQIAPSPEALQRLLVDNPQRLYRFPA